MEAMPVSDDRSSNNGSENSASTEWSAPATASPRERSHRRVAMPATAKASLDDALRRAADDDHDDATAAAQQA